MANDKKGMCQHDAGVLKEGKLSPEAKYRFIKELKELLTYGTKDAPAPPLPCGPEIPPFQYADMAPIEDESLYPELYKNVLGQYEKIALALDAKGSFPFAPIADPLALAVALNIDPPPKLNFPGDMLLYGLALPMMAVILKIPFPPDLLAKLPDLPAIPTPPQIPSIDFDPLQLPELLKFNGLLFNLPPKLIDVILNLIPKMPELIIKLCKVPPDFSPFCDAVFKAEPFGPFDGSKSTTWMASQIVLTRKTAECVTIHCVGATMGSAPGGMTGYLGGGPFELSPPPPDEQEAADIRSLIVQAAQSADGYSWEDDDTSLKSADPTPYAGAKYQWFLLPFECEAATKGGGSKQLFMLKHDELQVKSSCGLFARACLLKGHARGPSFTGPYNFNSGDVFRFIIQNATNYQALRSFNPNDANTVPRIQKGDILHVFPIPQSGAGHMLVVTQDYNGGVGAGLNLSAVGGGIEHGSSFKIGNNNINAIGNNEGFACIQYLTPDGQPGEWRQISSIIDSEKLITGTINDKGPPPEPST